MSVKNSADRISLNQPRPILYSHHAAFDPPDLSFPSSGPSKLMYRRVLASLAGGLFLLFTLVAGYIYYGILKNPEWLGQQFESQVARYFRSQIRTRQVTADHTGGLVRILGLRVSDPSAPENRPFIQVDEVQVQHTTTTVDEIDTIHLIHPVVHLDADQEGNWNFLQILRLDGVEGAGTPRRLPKISFSGATLHISHSALLRDESEHTIRRFNLHIIPDQQARTYTIRGWFEDDLLGACRFQGHWDLSNRQLRVQLIFDQISVGEEAIDRLRPDLALVLSRIGPRSRAELRATLQFDQQQTPPFRVTTDLHFWSGYARWGPLAFAEMTGSAVYSGGVGGRLKIQDLVARVGHSRIRIRGQVTDVGRTNGFNLSFRLDEPEPNSLLQTLFPPPFPLQIPHFQPGESLRIQGTARRLPEPDAPVELDTLTRRLAGPGGWKHLETLGRLRARVQALDQRTEGTAQLVWRGFHLDLEGAVERVPDRGVGLVVTARNVQLGESLYRLLAPRTRHVWDRVRPQGAIDITLRVDPTDSEQSGLASRTHLDVELQGIRALLHATPYPLEQVRGKIAVRFPDVQVHDVTIRHGPARVHVPRALYRFHGTKLVLISLDAQGTDIPLDEEVLSALDPGNREFLRRFHITGWADAWMKIRRDRKTGRQRQTIHASLRDVTFRHQRFPFPARDCHGTVLFTTEEVSADGTPLGRLTPGKSVRPVQTVVADLRMRLNDESDIRARLHVEAQPRQQSVSSSSNELDRSRYLLDIEATRVRMTPEWFGLFSPDLVQIWNPKPPHNFFDFRILVDQPLQSAPEVAMQIRPRGVTIVPLEIPYSIESLSGEMNLDETGLGWTQMRGRHGAAELTVSSVDRKEREKHRSRAGHPLTHEIDISLRGADLDDSFRRALPRSLQETWSTWSPQGKIDLRVRLKQEYRIERERDLLKKLQSLLDRTGASPTIGIDWDRRDLVIDLTCRGVQIQYDLLPYPVEDLRGQILIRDDVIQIPGLTGRRGPARLELSGHTIGAHDQAQLHLDLVGRSIPLDELLRSSLPENHRKTWDRLRPEGTIDIRANIRRTSNDSQTTTRVTLNPSGVRLQPTAFPYSLDLESGTLTVGPGATRLTDIRASHGSMTLEGSMSLLQLKTGSKLALHLHAQNLTLDEELRLAVETLRPELWKTWQPEGEIERLRLDLEALTNPEGESHWILEKAHIVPKGLSIRPGVQLSNLSGIWTISGSTYRGKRTLQGSVEKAGIEVKGLPISDLSGDFKIIDDGLWFEKLSGTSADGSIEILGRLGLDQKMTWRGELRFLNLDIKHLLKDWTQKPGGNNDLAGRLRGHIRLEGPLTEPSRIEGSGWLQLRDGRLWSLPIFIGIFDIFSLPKKSAFHRGELEFRLRNRIFSIRNATFESTPLEINGGGSIDLDGQTDLYFVSTLAPGLTPRIPILSQAWSDLKKNILPLHISGDIRDPSTRIVPLRFVQKMVSGTSKKR